MALEVKIHKRLILNSWEEFDSLVKLHEARNQLDLHVENSACNHNVAENGPLKYLHKEYTCKYSGQPRKSRGRNIRKRVSNKRGCPFSIRAQINEEDWNTVKITHVELKHWNHPYENEEVNPPLVINFEAQPAIGYPENDQANRQMNYDAPAALIQPEYHVEVQLQEPTDGNLKEKIEEKNETDDAMSKDSLEKDNIDKSNDLSPIQSNKQNGVCKVSGDTPGKSTSDAGTTSLSIDREEKISTKKRGRPNKSILSSSENVEETMSTIKGNIDDEGKGKKTLRKPLEEKLENNSVENSGSIKGVKSANPVNNKRKFKASNKENKNEVGYETPKKEEPQEKRRKESKVEEETKKKLKQTPDEEKVVEVKKSRSGRIIKVPIK